MTYALGIDIGTTFSAAAVWRDGRAETVPLGNRANAVPSVVLLRDDRMLLVGDAAARRAVAEPHRVAREFKRRIGDRVPLVLGDQAFTPQQLLAALVAWVIERVSEREGSAPAHVTLTHPANWGDYRKGLLRDAVQDAGLVNAGMIAEPVAAAIHYASQERIEAGAFIGVYDLGGGTFDATVLRKTADGFEIHGTPEGDDRLGGIDFDQAVISHVRTVLGETWSQLDLSDIGTMRAVAQVRANAVEAKEALSTDTQAGVAVILPGITDDVRLTRAELETALRAPLQRTVDIFRQAVERSGIEPSQLQHVLLVGGSSRIPLVSQMLTSQLGAQIAVDAHPKYAVCLGAAVAAGTRLARGVAGAAAAPAGGEARDFAAIVGDDDGGALGDTERIEVDLVDRGLTEALDVPFERSRRTDVPDAVVKRVSPHDVADAPVESPPAADADDTDEVALRHDAADDTSDLSSTIAASRGGFSGGERGRSRRPVATIVLLAFVVLAGAVAVSALRSDDPEGQQGAAPAPGAGASAPAQPPAAAIGAYDLAGLALTDVSPRSAGDFDATADNNIEALAVRDDVFVAVGRTPAEPESDALVLRSPDGRQWDLVVSPELGGDDAQQMYGATAGPDEVVGVGFDGARPNGDAAVWVGLDGQVERITSPDLAGDGHQEMRDVVWHDGRYVAVGCEDTVNTEGLCEQAPAGGHHAAVWLSADGRQWSRVDPDSVDGADTAMWGVTSTPAGLVAVGNEEKQGEESRIAAFWFSADGTEWSRVDVGIAGDSGESSAIGVDTIEGLTVAVGYDEAAPGISGDKDLAVWRTTDGRAWEQVAPDGRFPANQVANAIAALPDGFVAVGRDFRGSNLGAVWTSGKRAGRWQRRYEEVIPVDDGVFQDVAASSGHLVLGGHGSGALPGVRLWEAPASE